MFRRAAAASVGPGERRLKSFRGGDPGQSHACAIFPRLAEPGGIGFARPDRCQQHDCADNANRPYYARLFPYNSLPINRR